MKVSDIARLAGLEIICLPEPDREVGGGYTGDLLSWVMGRAEAGDAWVTIMSNINIVAVASLADAACVILAEGVLPDAGVSEKAREQGVNILSGKRKAFDLCAEIAALLRNA